MKRNHAQFECVGNGSTTTVHCSSPRNGKEKKETASLQHESGDSKLLRCWNKEEYFGDNIKERKEREWTNSGVVTVSVYFN